MAVNSLRFRIEGDNASALRALDQVSSKARGLGQDIQHELGKKFAAAISVTTIEEAVRRTGEWATELAKSAQNLGISVENMQALQLAAEHAGISTDKIFNYYNKIEAAALKALNGNKKLADSFQKLGIDASQLKTTNTSDLLSKSFAGANREGGEGALMNILGSKEVLNVRALRTEMGGRSIEEYGESKKSQIVPNEDVRAIGVAWMNIMDDIKSIGVTLAPVAKLVLTLVDGLAKMLAGIVGTITGVIGDIGSIAGFISAGDWKSAGRVAVKMTAGRLTAMGAGIGKMVTFGFADKKIDEWTKHSFGMDDLSEEENRFAEGAGQGIATVATFGTGGVAKTAGAGIKGAGSLAEMAGSEALAANLGKMGAGVSKSGNFGMFGKLAEKIAKYKYFKDFNQANATADKIGMEMLGITESQAELPLFKQALNRIKDEAFQAWGIPVNSRQAIAKWGRMMGVTSMLGTAGAFGAAGSSGRGDINASNLFQNTGGLPPGSANRSGVGGLGGGGFANLFGAGSGNLNVGGVFGVDLQAKLVSLNEKQTAFLEKIMEYTGRMADEDYNGEDTVPN